MTALQILFILSYLPEVSGLLKVAGGIFVSALTAYGAYRHRMSKLTISEAQERTRAQVDRIRRFEEAEETSAKIIKDLKQNIHNLNECWLEENISKTRAEALSLRRKVALDLLSKICPECYDKLPDHFKVGSEIDDD